MKNNNNPNKPFNKDNDCNDHCNDKKSGQTSMGKHHDEKMKEQSKKQDPSRDKMTDQERITGISKNKDSESSWDKQRPSRDYEESNVHRDKEDKQKKYTGK